MTGKMLIRNIDNVTIAPVREPTILHERLLVGLTLELQRKIHELLKQAVEGQMSEVALDDALRWCEQALEASIMPEIWKATVEQRQSHLRHILDRPLRVCAMVRNEGEPGGGPYWVREEDGSISKQIVESSQVDFERDDQREIFRAATHFNPVDMVCALRDPFGKGYSLERFVDARRGFIARKSHEGRPLKALERPGLWNGAMAGWNTVFVEVPVETFNPVKTVLDLLRPAHQPR